MTEKSRKKEETRRFYEALEEPEIRQIKLKKLMINLLHGLSRYLISYGDILVCQTAG